MDRDYLKREEFVLSLSFDRGNGVVVSVGGSSLELLGEIRDSYANGNFAAVIVLTLALVEHDLGGKISYLVESKSRDGLHIEEIIRKAKVEKFISVSEESAILRIKSNRNSLIHNRSPENKNSLLGRAMDSGIPPEDILAHDAKEAIVFIHEYLCARNI